MAKSVIEVLAEARELVRKGWCQGPMAIDRRGRFAIASALDKKDEESRPCAWCLWGALFAVYKKLGTKDRTAESLLDAEARSIGFSGAVDFNERPGRTQAEVLDLFDAAIAKAREPKVEQ